MPLACITPLLDFGLWGVLKFWQNPVHVTDLNPAYKHSLIVEKFWIE